MENVSTNDKMDWTNKLILEFIYLYESHPVLWDAKHKEHKNRNRLCDAWQSIADEISADVTVEELRRKKESLMATYRNLSRKVRDSRSTGSDGKDLYAPTWFAFDAIDRFISATSKKNTSLSSEGIHNKQLSVGENYINNEEELRNSDEIFEPELLETIEDGDYLLPQGAHKKRGREDASQDESNHSKHLQIASDLSKVLATDSQGRRKETLEDRSALYGRLLAVKLRRISRRNQIILQNKIDNLVFEAELSEIDAASPTISEPSKSPISPTFPS